jgi:hypothetical protein
MGENVKNAFGFFSTKGHCVGCNAPLDSSSKYCITCPRCKGQHFVFAENANA